MKKAVQPSIARWGVEKPATCHSEAPVLWGPKNPCSLFERPANKGPRRTAEILRPSADGLRMTCLGCTPCLRNYNFRVRVQARLTEMAFWKVRQLALSIVGCEGYPNRVVKESHSRGWVLGARGWGRTVGRGEKAESDSKFKIQDCPGPRTHFSMVQWLNDSMLLRGAR
jgi:hypothetical protein